MVSENAGTSPAPPFKLIRWPRQGIQKSGASLFIFASRLSRKDNEHGNLYFAFEVHGSGYS
jgi:hypothetical protein